MGENKKTLNETLDFLSKFSEENFVDIWIPSFESNLKFKEISAEQQKRIVGASINRSIYNKDFNEILKQIIEENINCSDINYMEKLTMIDKIFIVIVLKSKISAIYNIEKDGENVEINLEKIIKNFTKYIHPKAEIIENDKIKIKIEIPSISKDSKNQKTGQDDIDSTKELKLADLKNILSEAFIGEITKYISTFEIKDFGEIDYDSLSYDDKFKLVEKLPASLIKEILNFVNKWKKDLDKFLTFTKNKKDYIIKVDPIFMLN